MQIVVLCPPVGQSTGGIKYLFRMTEALRRAGHDAVVYEGSKSRPAWFENDAPIVGREVFRNRPDQILVLPEDQPKTLRACAPRPQRQNQFYAAGSARDRGGYADLGVSHILCSGRAVYDYCRYRHPEVPAYLTPCGVDPALLRPRSKRECITYIPRKRRVEVIYVRDLFRFTHPEFRHIEWLPLEDKSEKEIAATLAESSVFLALNRLDEFGLTPIEAMASGCVVAGFTGIGGREYATPENGFWADDDDFPACVQRLAEAVTLSRETGARRVAYSAACMRTTANYTPTVFEDALGSAWAKILPQHA